MARYDMSNMDFADMASAGDAEVLLELGLIYASGRNGQVDVISAHKWLNIAAFRGLEQAKNHREELAVEMTREEISQAQREARDWITKH